MGKTSHACATGVALADAGKRVLLVSTDPASNLDKVLGQALSSTPTPIPDVPRLGALNVNPEAAARSYRERLVGPYRRVLVEVPVMLSVCRICNGSRMWYQQAIPTEAAAGHTSTANVK